MSPSQCISHLQVPFDISDSTGEGGLPASGCSGSGLPEFAIYEANLEPHGSTAFLLFAFKTKHTKQQLWHNRQQQIHNKQSKVLSPLHRLEYLCIWFHKDRDACLCVRQNLVASSSFHTSLMTYLAPFKEKKTTTADTFPPSKSQGKLNKICGGGLSDLTPGNKDNHEDFLRALFWRVSRDKSLLWIIISDQNSCQLKTIQPFPRVSSHWLEARPLSSPSKGPSMQLFCQTCFCWTELSHVDLVKRTRSRFRLALESPSSIC